MSVDQPPRTPGRAWLLLSRWWGPVVLLAAGIIMLSWTWGTWPDVLVDFGPQLYVPWQLAEGKVLYRDIEHYNGPLSQYVGALAFRVFGTALWILIAWNLLILSGLTVLLYWMLSQVASRWSAAIACVCFLLLFAFAQYIPTGNYNYVCPYAHEMTHGVTLSLLALALIWQYPKWGLWAFAGSGWALGLAFLTKAEVFVGGAAGVGAALLLTLWHERPPRRRAAGMMLIFAGSLLLPPLVAFTLLAQAMPASKALVGTIGSWAVVGAPRVTRLFFFRHTMGVDDIRGNLRHMLVMSGWYAAAIVPLVLAALVVGRYRLPRWLASGIVFVVAALILPASKILQKGIVWANVARPFANMARPFPLILLLVGVALVLAYLRRGQKDPAAGRRISRQITLTVLALAMLAKMILHVRIWHYGFVLAMPGALVLVVALLDWTPTLLERVRGAGVVLAGGVLGLLVTVLAAHLLQQAVTIGAKTCAVGKGLNQFWTDDIRGSCVNATLDVLATRRFPPEATLVALPEGIMLNYLSRRVNPTPYTNCMPTEVKFFGEDNILASLQAHPPDLILLVHKNTEEFGYHYFGWDYGRDIGRWVTRRYDPVGLVGFPPFRDGRFGIQLMQKKAKVPAEASGGSP